ncbi:2Fe-2S iron-sulfur cluster-binding protein [Arenibaculum sp.]|jgi:CDP-4-dehydro-6-deoxyglucose reductase/ferredoxin-NAD(P)+ reductase (naphthalene dioxygenase ferredoxin-specific)|uniref:2Fe-2S iron-sulfur cluster-binding protein n=1 Tax=Arenibaculum sp. TaxID=2865862 RepID=UPI002E0E747E|nr:2Fe-2S iron-sulfur cluster-binding protein [Arenibaculum sp.]
MTNIFEGRDVGVSVKIRQAAAPVTVEPGATILEAALAGGVPYPHGCRSGNCGACKSQLLAGEVDLAPHSDYALGPEERARGLILACRAVPWEDCEVAWLEEEDTVLHPSRRLSCRVVSVERATHDIRVLRLAVVSGGPFSFSAGQFASLTFDGLPARDYSMANRPEEAELEFHVRDMGGRVSRHVAERLRPGDDVTVTGPSGTAHLREGHTGPILAVAGGSGLAPVKSVVETALARGMRQPIHLFFGARDERDLYLLDRFEALAAAHPNFRFVPVLSAPEGPTGRRTGYVGEVAAAALPDLDGCKAYLAGPPAMVEGTVPLLEARGMRAADIHADAFYTEAEKNAAAGKGGSAR